MSEKLTKEQIAAKAEELEKKFGVKIHPIEFYNDDDGEDQILGFIKDPPRHVKLGVLDKSLVSPITAASELLEACLIKEESDERILSERPESDRIYLGATMAALGIVRYTTDQYKKNRGVPHYR